jgi:type IV secretion system protein VirD4
VVRLWLGALILALGARRQRPARRTLMLIDEAGQLGRMEPLLQTATLLRGCGVTLWTFFQSPAQIESIYGPDAMVLADNAGVIQLFAARNGRVAESYARLLGDVSPEAVMQLGPDEQLLLMDGGRSFRCRRINYLDDPLCRGLADPNPMHAPPEGALGRPARKPAVVSCR